MNVYSLQDYEKIKNDLINFKLGILPTDTIYGYTCLIGDHNSKNKIFELKKRPKNKELIVLVNSVKMLKELIILKQKDENILGTQNEPTTIIGLKNLDYPYSDLISEIDSIGVRVINKPWLQKLISETGPLFSTSVNVSGENYLLDLENYNNDKKVDFIVKDGKLDNKPSKIYNSITNEWIRY
ncbi:Sua5/YciO/YrdC/YwlC family protein [Spiroplasma endosymbiont of Amphibalanus improvisus]|uniref:Sua5/YciO/YrdC/YwlC family protein n=1 Tax=Spiroplasma endosymbiont of Amphibalanus improvisus TaxID=3066327 RepID=UPI00313D97F0